MAVKLSAVRVVSSLSPRRFLVFTVRGRVNLRAVVLQGLGKLRKFSVNGILTRNLSARSIAPQPTAPRRAPSPNAEDLFFCGGGEEWN
jgi:hypothetical protein